MEEEFTEACASCTLITQSSISVHFALDGTWSGAQPAEKEAGDVAFFQTALCPAKPCKFSF